MSVQFIKNGNQSGWQARAYTTWPKYVSEFFAINTYGAASAREMALVAEKRLKRRAKKERT